MLRHSFNRTKGFTIVELAVVIVVIAILAAITIVSYTAISRNATKKSVESDLRGLSAQISADKVKNGIYMETLNSAVRYQEQEHSASYYSSDDTYCVSLTSIKDPSIAYRITQEGNLEEGACAVVVRQIIAGTQAVYSLGSNGKVYAVGGNSAALGDGTFTNRLSPVAVNETGSLGGKIITQMAAVDSSAFALASDGTLHGWGYNASNVLGNGTVEAKTISIPINLGSLAGKTVVAISGGTLHMLALASDGTLHAWGGNGFGQVGNNSTNNTQSTPVQINSFGSLNGKTITKIFAKKSNSFALASDGTLHAWGANNLGQLGNGSTGASSLVPIDISTRGSLNGRTVKTMAAGSTGDHMFAITTDGRLNAWGRNTYGQLGLGTTSSVVLPTLVTTADTPIDISTGEEFSLMRTASGNIYTWGLGSSRQLGNNSTATVTSPTLINSFGALNGVKTRGIASGGVFGAVLGANGRVYSWGTNTRGPLGDGSTTTRNIPVLANPLP